MTRNFFNLARSLHTHIKFTQFIKKCLNFHMMVLCLFLLPSFLFAQQNTAFNEHEQPKKFALVIGNANYAGMSALANPVNDANDIAAVLEHLGFTVEKVLNGSLEQMEDASMRLKEKLSTAENTYGFSFTQDTAFSPAVKTI